MDKRIERIRDEIRRTEAKKREVEEYLKTLRMKERQLCDEEILKTMRGMAGKGDVLEVLKRLTDSDPDAEIDKKNNEISHLEAVGLEDKALAAFSNGESEEDYEDK